MGSSRVMGADGYTDTHITFDLLAPRSVATGCLLGLAWVRSHFRLTDNIGKHPTFSILKDEGPLSSSTSIMFRVMRNGVTRAYFSRLTSAKNCAARNLAILPVFHSVPCDRSEAATRMLS